MVYRRRGYKKYGKYKRYRKYRKTNTSKKINMVTKVNRAPVSTSFNRSLIMPDRYVTRLKWAAQTYAKAVTAGAIYNIVVRGNSVYDPDSALGGLSAKGLPELAALYETYLVVGSKITVTTRGLIPGDDLGAPIGYEMCVVPYNGDISPTAPPFELSQYNKAKYRLVPAAGGPITKVTSYQSTAAQFGVAPRAVLDDSSYSSYVTANPGIEWYWMIALKADNALLSGTYGLVNIEVVYYTVMKDRKDIIT